jgi:uncharacterized protein (TIGR00661 family)
MKILMGVQATGNGHITRARAMNEAFSARGIEVDTIFSGRDRDQLFDMEMFGDYRCYKGLTFVTNAGAVKPIATFQRNSLRQLYRDICTLDLSAYDLVITDFEPITAWAAKRQKKMSIAIGHQNAFDYAIPKRYSNPIVQLFMNYFAPAQIRLGLHWHHFGQPILPPIADVSRQSGRTVNNKIVVYLGFENQDQVIEWLTPFSDYEFYIYSPFPQVEDRGHLHLRPLSREGFQQDLANCNGVISNAGFELASEAIHLGKKILVKPLKGQMEQASNALALENLGLGMEMKHLDAEKLRNWLEYFESKQVIYPRVADAIAAWIAKKDYSNVNALVDTLWAQVESPHIENFSSLYALS